MRSPPQCQPSSALSGMVLSVSVLEDPIEFHRSRPMGVVITMWFDQNRYIYMGSKDLGLVTIYFNCLYYAASRLRFAASRR